MKRLLLTYVLLLTAIIFAAGQEISVLGENNPSNPTLTRTQVRFDFDSYFLVGENRVIAARPSFEYGFNSQRSLARIEVPILSTFYSGNFQGFERRVGLGDINFGYKFLPYLDRSGRKVLQAIALSMDITSPTGDAAIGLGLGKWQYEPSITFEFRPSAFFAFYPRASYNFTVDDVNGQPIPGGGTIPDPGEDQQAFETMIIDAPTVVELMDWQGWFSINPIFLFNFKENYSIVALGADIGKMVGPKFSSALHFVQFIGGQPRLQTQVSAQFNFYLQ